MNLFLLLGALCGMGALASLVGLPFAVRGARTAARIGAVTTGIVSRTEFSEVNECSYVDVRFEIDGVAHEARVRTHRSLGVGDPFAIRYKRTDPTNAFPAERSLWIPAVVLLVLLALSLGGAIVLLWLGLADRGT